MNIEHYENILDRLSIFDNLESNLHSISYNIEKEQFTVHLNLAKSGHQVYEYKDIMPYKFTKVGNNSRKTTGSSRAEFIRALDALINNDIFKKIDSLIEMMHLTNGLIGLAYHGKNGRIDVCYWNAYTDLIEG